MFPSRLFLLLPASLRASATSALFPRENLTDSAGAVPSVAGLSAQMLVITSSRHLLVHTEFYQPRAPSPALGALFS